MKTKSLAERVSEKLLPKKAEAKKPDFFLDAVRELRNAKTDEEAAEALRGCIEISKLDVD
jgi:hypothetical protein